MAMTPDAEDDDFDEIYKAYTGPQGYAQNASQEREKPNKESSEDSEEEDASQRDPNAVPTDFTSREARLWEAKSKATERNWKKRKEEEMICKLCGDKGHFTQGCPSTLGANRKSQDFFERVPARDKQTRALFTEKVISKIEREIGCKIKMEEKFIIVSGKDRLILGKGVDAVHKVIKGESESKNTPASRRSRSRSAERSPPSRARRSESQRAHLDHSRDASQHHQRFARQDRIMDDHARDMGTFSNPAPSAFGSDGTRSHASRSRSPTRVPYSSNTYESYDIHGHNAGGHRSDGWNHEKRGSNAHSSRERFRFPHSLEELELDYKRSALDLDRARDKEEEEESSKHRECLKEIRDNYLKKLAVLRNTQTRQWEKFLQFSAQYEQYQSMHHISASTYGAYKEQPYAGYGGSADPHFTSGSGDPYFSSSNIPMDHRALYAGHAESYSSRPHEPYGEFQNQRHDGYGNAYDRF